MLKKFLQELYEKFEIQATPNKGKAGVYELTLNAQHVIQVEPLTPGFSLSSSITALPHLSREALFIYLMKANFLGQGTGGSVIGIDHTEKFLILSLTIPYELNYRMFEEKLENYINFLEYWRTEIEYYNNNSIL